MKSKTHIRLVRALMPFVCFAFFGCGPSGAEDGGDEPSDQGEVTNNLTASGLVVVSAEPRVGYLLEVNTFIEAEELTENVSVTYYALNKSDVDQELDEVRQFFLAAVTFPAVEPSDSEYLAEFTVPPEVDPPGEYVIQYIIDPTEDGGEIKETDEDDNINSGDVLLAPIGDPNLFIEELTLDLPIVFLYSDDDDVEQADVEQDGQMVEDVHDSDAGATLIVGLEGSLEPVDAKVFVYLRITRDDIQDNHDVPMYLWDSVAQKYVDAYGTPPEGLSIGTLSPQMVTEAEGGETQLPPDGGVVEMVTGAEDTDALQTSDRTSLHLDVYFPGGLAEEMKRIIDTLPCQPGFVCTLSDQPPIVAPPDLTKAAIEALRDFFRGATRQSVTEKKTRFSIVAKVVSGTSGFLEDRLDDNEASEAVDVDLNSLGRGRFVPPAAGEPIKGVGDGTEAGFDGKNFGVSFNFDSGASLDTRGAIAFVEGGVPVRIFDFLEFDFMRLEARAQVVPAEDPEPPEDETSGFNLEFYFLDQLVMLEPGALSTDPRVPPFGVPIDQPLGYTYPPTDPDCPDDDNDNDKVLNEEMIDGVVLNDECPDEPGYPVGVNGATRRGCPGTGGSAPDSNGCPGTDEFSISKEVTYNQLFFVGPVPFTASAGVGGAIGFELYANIQPFGLAAKAGPFAKLEATITGAVGIPVLKAGFGGTLTFIDERFRGNVTTGLALSFNGGGDPIGFEGHLSMSVINTLTGPQGELFLFVDYPVVKWCTVLRRTFPCGLPTIRNKLVLAKFESFVKEDVLFDVTLCKARTFGIPGERLGTWSACP